jgi:hypothetical protein
VLLVRYLWIEFAETIASLDVLRTSGAGEA